MVQPSGKWPGSKIHLTYDPRNPLPGIHPRAEVSKLSLMGKIVNTSGMQAIWSLLQLLHSAIIP